MQQQLSTGLRFIGRHLAVDVPSELAEALRNDDAGKHGYAYRPFTDGDAPGPGSAWLPQVRGVWRASCAAGCA